MTPQIIVFWLIIAVFAVCLFINGRVDVKKGELLPNSKYWGIPAVCILGLCVLQYPLDHVELFTWIAIVLAFGIYVVFTYRGRIGGADFFGLTLSAILLGIAFGWPAILLFAVFTHVLIPLCTYISIRVSDVVRKMPELAAKLPGFISAETDKSKLLRVLPFVSYGFIMTVLVQVLIRVIGGA